MLPVKAPRDPAPSRAKYRLERLWLTPTIRNFVRFGLPLLIVAGLIAHLAANPQVRTAIASGAGELRTKIASHPGLMIEEIALDDVSPDLVPVVKAKLDIPLPISSIDLNLEALHEQVLDIDAVASAHLRVEGQGVLRVSVTQRVPRVLWRTDEGLILLDDEGVRVGTVNTRADRADLPLIVGRGADRAVSEAMDLLRLADPVSADLRALLRVGERRWDLVLSNDTSILLPEGGAAAALSRVMALHDAEDILERDVISVDMRDGRRPLLRLTPEALYELRRLRGQIGEEDA